MAVGYWLQRQTATIKTASTSFGARYTLAHRQLMGLQAFGKMHLFEQAFLLQAIHDSRPQPDVTSLCSLV